MVTALEMLGHAQVLGIPLAALPEVGSAHQDHLLQEAKEIK